MNSNNQVEDIIIIMNIIVIIIIIGVITEKTRWEISSAIDVSLSLSTIISIIKRTSGDAESALLIHTVIS